MKKKARKITALQYIEKSETNNDTSVQPQSERITIQGSHKTKCFVGKGAIADKSDAFA